MPMRCEAAEAQFPDVDNDSDQITRHLGPKDRVAAFRQKTRRRPDPLRSEPEVITDSVCNACCLPGLKVFESKDSVFRIVSYLRWLAFCISDAHQPAPHCLELLVKEARVSSSCAPEKRCDPK